MQQTKKTLQPCLFNLVLFSSEQKKTKFFCEMLHTMLQKFPCRILSVQIDSELPESEVTIKSSSENTSPFNSEEIMIRSGTNALEKVPFHLFSNLVSDLPIYLVWDQDPNKDAVILPKLLPYARRLIIDSDFIDNLNDYSKMIASIQKKRAIELMDINWAIIGGWRDALSELTDSAERVNFWQSLCNLEITYTKETSGRLRHYETQPLFLQAWIASRLGWKIQQTTLSDNLIAIAYKRGEQTISIRLIAKIEDQSIPGSVTSLKAQSIDGREIVCTKQQGLQKIIVHHSSKEKCDLPYSLLLPDVRKSSIFIQELFYHQMSSQFYSMLDTFHEKY